MITGQAIVAAAEQHKGHPYIWGGWDCSGFVNHVLSQVGLPIPGYRAGQYHGPPPHGPVVQDYASWPGAVPVTTPAPGDLAIWWQPGAPAGGHIGIYVGGGRMISALDPSLGTLVTPVAGNGPPGVRQFYRRPVGAVIGGVASSAAAAAAPPGQQTSAAGLLAVGVAAVLAVGLAAVVVILLGSLTAGGITVAELGGQQ